MAEKKTDIATMTFRGAGLVISIPVAVFVGGPIAIIEKIRTGSDEEAFEMYQKIAHPIVLGAMDFGEKLGPPLLISLLMGGINKR